MMSEKIDINTADAATLTTISGIGSALAERIIEYRETVHPFEEVIELVAVPGISEKMVRSFEDFVTVQPTLRTTAVPLQLDEPEDLPLLDAPEEVILLGAPDQPEGLLAAELADTATEVEEVVAAETNATEPEQWEETEAPPPVEEEIEEAGAETAEVNQAEADSPEIEELPLAGPMRPAMPEPDLFAAAPTQPSAEWEAKAQRRGCLNALLGATFGAILGAVLTLAILAALNQGSLSFAASDSEIRQQLDTEIISRTNELNQLSTRVSLAATQEAAANQSLQTDFAATSEAINEALANNEEIISYLATRSGDLELRLQEVAGAADTFTGFLDGLRLLLDDLEEGTATPTPARAEETVSPTPTPTPIRTGTDTPTPSATTAVSPTAAPTRTPQPTATPFTFPTNTPAPQP
jgi:competence ComEA-like helix-hairpin-helix protein